MKPNREKEAYITRDLLLEMYDYNRETGKLYHKKSRGKAKRGDEVGCVRPIGYRVTMIRKKQFLIHRLIWVIETGSFPDNIIDHINRDKDDNRIENLRDVTQLENLLNKELFVKQGGVRTREYKLEYLREWRKRAKDHHRHI